MGKNNKHKHKQGNLKQSNIKPFVSICTPTFNRRPFIPFMLKCFEQQDYPKDRMEWIIIDDGTDKIGDLVAQHPQVKYYPLEKKLLLGQKRNLMHDMTKGDILVYMDDDDYYPPERVSHAVDILQKTPKHYVPVQVKCIFFLNISRKCINLAPMARIIPLLVPLHLNENC